MASLMGDKTVPRKGDDAFGIVCGDLGMGEGLKPGGLLQLNSELGQSEQKENNSPSSEPERLFYYDSSNVPTDNISCNDLCECDNESECTNVPNGNSHNCTGCSFCHTHRSSLKKIRIKSNDDYQLCGQSDEDCDIDGEDFPSYANVPLGTSLRQQKKLYEKNLGTILRNHSQPPIVVNNDKIKPNSPGGKNKTSERSRRLSSFEIEKKLVDAVTEVEELKIEIETCRRRLDAKYRAIAILKKQAEEARSEVIDHEKMTKDYTNILAMEVNKLNFELQWRESSFMDSQELWAQRFDRVCQENAVLMSTLEARSEELRRTNAHKMALSRERDELLALMDVKEKLKYEKTKSQSSEDEYGTFSSAELAVLGACRCRGTNPEPCGCAHAAASLRRDIIKLKEEIDLQKQRTEETYLTVDAYRKAFEEQIHRNKVLSLKLAELSVPSVSKSVKAKAAIKWLISVLNDDDIDSSSSNNQILLPESRSRMYAEELQSLNNNTVTCMPPQELVNLLTEMIHEKNEALAHQKLAAQILANKNQQLEEQLAKIKEDDVFKCT
ncbi:coiled-coil domain-containing protein 125 isoform X2 [Patella vulgata]|uniref:coiled-coil domain-containing protein 125 isoform X2 n=2 Tax=Patella vulgata TaxID=6465 RepID=UPI002180596B|nr:coiled-coil domain-containing protein 125 isoform X2 [Patella vulgata]